jgi:hypothetical protein
MMNHWAMATLCKRFGVKRVMNCKPIAFFIGIVSRVDYTHFLSRALFRSRLGTKNS